MLLLLIASLTLIQTGDTFFFFSGESTTPMQEMLDMMQQLMNGDAQFDRNFIKEVRTCMATFDPELPDVHDKTWQGIIDYWDMGGNSDDPWGSRTSGFDECNIIESSYRGMTIYESCNFASNVAYNHLLTELCERKANGNDLHMRPEYITALGKMYSALSVGSSFMHGSNTELGRQHDGNIIRILAYLLHQGIMDAWPIRSSILNDLCLESRPMTSLQIVDFIQNMYSSEPVDRWYNIMGSIDMPNYYLGFAGPAITMLHLIFEDDVVDKLVPIFSSLFGLNDEYQEFMSKYFIPELRSATPNIDRKKPILNNFLGNSVGTLLKMPYAFIWQEDAIFDNELFLKPISNKIGWALLPIVNKILYSAMNYQYYQPEFQKGVNIYPGEQWCNPEVAHAKWHVQSGIVFLDFFYLCDEMNRFLAPTRN